MLSPAPPASSLGGSCPSHRLLPRRSARWSSSSSSTASGTPTSRRSGGSGSRSTKPTLAQLVVHRQLEHVDLPAVLCLTGTLWSTETPEADRYSRAATLDAQRDDAQLVNDTRQVHRSDGRSRASGDASLLAHRRSRPTDDLSVTGCLRSAGSGQHGADRFRVLVDGRVEEVGHHASDQVSIRCRFVIGVARREERGDASKDHERHA